MESEKFQNVCPDCQKIISESEPTWTCKTCSSVYHEGCGYKRSGLTFGGNVALTHPADSECDRCKDKQKLANPSGQFQSSETQTEEEVKKLNGRVKALEKRSRQDIVGSWIYILILCFVVIFTGLLVWRGWAEIPEVSIQFNVGEIIGGVLVGLGAVLAATAYYKSTRRRQ